MGQGLWEKAEDQLALLLCACEQCAHDDGRWTVAWLLTHLPEPNWTRVGVQPRGDAIRPFARLPDPSWVTTAIALNKDVASLKETRKAPPPKAGVFSATATGMANALCNVP